MKTSELIKVGPIATCNADAGGNHRGSDKDRLHLRFTPKPQDTPAENERDGYPEHRHPVTAQVLAAKGLLQERASQIILAAAVIDDVPGLLILAPVRSLAKGKVNVPELALTATLAIGFTVIAVKWGAKTLKRVVPHVMGKLRAGQAQFAMAMILLFALSFLAVYAGVAAIIGAFPGGNGFG